MAVLILLGAAAAVVAYYYFSRDLPDMLRIASYQPELVNEVYSADGTLVAEFASRKRKLVPYEEIPDHVKHAFIAIEDKRFYEHGGFDVIRIIGALIKNIEEGRIVQGGSTITQQVVKNLLFSPKRSITRKIKEAILSYRMERTLSKDEIFYIYLNHIYLGDNCYGIEAASQNYFGKSVRRINIAEAALLAALPKAPEKYSPRKHLDRALRRQRLVLRMMLEQGLITRDQWRDALQYKIHIVAKKNTNLEIAPYYIEAVRRHLENKVGTRAFLHGGYKVFTALDIDLSLAAQWALRRRGWDLERRNDAGPVVARLKTTRELRDFLAAQGEAPPEVSSTYEAAVLSVEPIDQTPYGKAVKRQYLYRVNLAVGRYKAYMNLALSKPLGTAVPLFSNPYSSRYAPANGYKGWSLADFVPKPGDVIRVKITGKAEGGYIARWDYLPSVEGALLAMDTRGYVLAMVGGQDFARSQFNRALQARRQPGSAFKPILYAAAIDRGLNETAPLWDMPVMIGDWMPRNYDETTMGLIPMRKALAKSRNLASIRLILDIGPDYVARYASRFGFVSKLNPYPSLALGGSDVTLVEMVRAYNVFATEGKLVEPKLILRIYDRNGKIIEDNTAGELLSRVEMEKLEKERKREEIIREIARRSGKEPLETPDQGSLIEADLATHAPGPFLTPRTGSAGRRSYLTPSEFLEFVKVNHIPPGPAPAAEDVLAPDTAYIMVDMLRAVIAEGTGRRARPLRKLAPIAGKTGTTNNYTDAWFIGFSPKVIAGVWVGRDDHSTLGEKESGSRASLPVWMDFMRVALKRFPGGEFPVPEGIHFASTPFGFLPFKKGKSFEDDELKYLESQYLPPSTVTGGGAYAAPGGGRRGGGSGSSDSVDEVLYWLRH